MTMAVSQTLAQASDLAFEAALAGYVAALVCYGIEFALGRRIVPTEAEAASVSARSKAGGVAVLTREGGGYGVVPAAPAKAPWSERWGRAAVVVTVIGVLANLASVVLRGFAVQRLPLGNMYEFSSFLCAAAVVVWLVVLRKIGNRSLGLFVMLPVVLLTFVAGSVLYVPAGEVKAALNSYWKWIHVTTIATSSSVLLVSGAASLMYVLRHRYERRAAEAPVASSRPGEQVAAAGDRSMLAKLPSLAVLDRVAYRTAIIAFPIFTFAIISGAMWAEAAWGRPWNWDPKEIGAFVSWVCYACYLHARATAGWRGVRAAWISVIGFATIIFNLFFVNMVVSGLHSYAGL